MNSKIKVGGNDYCISRLEINECHSSAINVVLYQWEHVINANNDVPVQQ